MEPMQVPTNQSHILPDETGAGPNAQQPYSQPPAAQPPFQQQPLLCSKCRLALLMLAGRCEFCGVWSACNKHHSFYELAAVCIPDPLFAIKLRYVGSKGYRRFLTLEMCGPVHGGKRSIMDDSLCRRMHMLATSGCK